MNRTLDKAMQLQALPFGKGMQYLVDEGARILGNPILTHDMEYRVIAYTNHTVIDDPIWQEFAENGCVGFERLLFYRDECFFEQAANAKKITLLQSEKLQYNRIFGKLFTAESVQVGCACMVFCNAAFIPEDAQLFELFCDILTRECSKSVYFQQYGQQYTEDFFNKLIDGEAIDEMLYTAHIESIYNGLDSILRVAVADFSACRFASYRLEYHRELFRSARPDLKYAIRGDSIIFLLSSHTAEMKPRYTLRKLYRLIEENNIQVGVSGCFENVMELRQYYEQAVRALQVGKCTERRIHIADS